jgi:hypothetical protein
MKEEMLYGLIAIVLGFLTLVAQVSFLFASDISIISEKDKHHLKDGCA